MLFSLVRKPTPVFERIFDRFPPQNVMLSIVAIAYPIWGIIGAIMGILYVVSVEQAPGADSAARTWSSPLQCWSSRR